MQTETPSLDEIWIQSKKHFADDKNFHEEIKNQFERMEPMIKAFEKREIIRSVFETETQTWYIYSKRILTFGALVAGAIAIVKFIANR